MDNGNLDIIDVRNPRTGEADYTITPASRDQIARLCASLRSAQAAWAGAGIEHRVEVLRSWADAIEAHAAEISRAEEIDTGRRRVAREVPHIVAAQVRGWCDQAPGIVQRARLQGTSSVSKSVTFSTEFDPYPLVGVISPWNHPFLLSTLDAIPAVLAGCAVVIKPSEITPRFVEPVMSTIEAVPELAAVFSYVVGAAATGQAIIAEVDALCFTGSVPTGRKVAVGCAERFIPAFLELGGKDAAIVTASANVEQSAAAVLRGSAHNNGQLCFSTERVYVDQSIYDAFVAELTRQSERLKPNYPDIDMGHLGPFILGRQADIVDAHLDDAVAKGAKIECGGPTRNLGGGRYMDATVVTGVNHDMAIMREETFGPVTPVMPYSDLAAALALANDSEFGLSGSIIAGSEEEARDIAQGLNAGAISLQDTALTINIIRDVEKTSYGHSGMGGSRMGPNGMLRFLRRKALIAQQGQIADMDALSEHATLARA